MTRIYEYRDAYVVRLEKHGKEGFDALRKKLDAAITRMEEQRKKVPLHALGAALHEADCDLAVELLKELIDTGYELNLKLLGPLTCEEVWDESKTSAINAIEDILLKEEICFGYRDEDTELEDLTSSDVRRWVENAHDPDWDCTSSIYDHGLCFDWVPPNTFSDQKSGYFRYQLSWGWPSTEFRFFVDISGEPYCIEYWHLDWFDGFGMPVIDGERETMLKVWDRMTGGGDPETINHLIGRENE